jgi:hypothetical protein
MPFKRMQRRSLESQLMPMPDFERKAAHAVGLMMGVLFAITFALSALSF